MIEAEVVNNVPKLEERMRVWRKLVNGELLKSVAKQTANQARKRVHTTKSTPDLKRWPPRKHDYPHPMLVKTGALLRSLGKKRQGAAEYKSGVMAPFAAKVAQYAVYQQYGTRRGIDPRPFIGVGIGDIQEIHSLINRFVELRFT